MVLFPQYSLWLISIELMSTISSLADPDGRLRGLQPPLIKKKIVVIHVAVVIDLVVTSTNNACLCALNGGLPSLFKTISQRSRQRYKHLSRRLDRSDRVIHNESRDSKAVMCVCLLRDMYVTMQITFLTRKFPSIRFALGLPIEIEDRALPIGHWMSPPWAILL